MVREATQKSLVKTRLVTITAKIFLRTLFSRFFSYGISLFD